MRSSALLQLLALLSVFLQLLHGSQGVVVVPPRNQRWRSVLREKLKDPDPGAGIGVDSVSDDDEFVGSFLEVFGKPEHSIASSPLELAELVAAHQWSEASDGSGGAPVSLRASALAMSRYLQSGFGRAGLRDQIEGSVPPSELAADSGSNDTRPMPEFPFDIGKPPKDGGKDIFTRPLEQPVKPSSSTAVAIDIGLLDSLPRDPRKPAPSRHVTPGAAIAPDDLDAGGMEKPVPNPPTPKPTPTPPDIARRQHSAVLIGGDRMMVFGGLDQYSRVRNDLWQYHIAEDRWDRVPARRGPQPSKRVRHCAIIRYNEMVVFGGMGRYWDHYWKWWRSRYLNDVWSFDMDTLEWRKLSWRGTGPHRRERSAAVYANSRMYIVGGYGGYHFNDVWEFRFSRNRWYRKWTYRSKRPRGRASHGAAFEEFLYIFGGVDWWTVFNDLWRFNILTNMWQQISPNSEAPAPRCMFSMVSRGRIFVFGGFNGRYELNDLWYWDLPTNEWNPVPFDMLFNPVPRLREHTAVLHGDRLIVHGGWGGMSTSARTYAIDVNKQKAKTIGWIPVRYRYLMKDSLEYMLNKYDT